MSLRLQAAADLKAIVEDSVGGFGWPITVTNPDGVTAAMVGLSTDVNLTIDPETGQAVAGRRASVALALATLATLGLGVPVGIEDCKRKPWLVVFSDIGNSPQTFKVKTALPDRAIGLVVCELEAYRTA